MTVFITGVFFIYGVIFGSFFNVVGLRIPKKESILARSQCPNCLRKLGWKELIPIASYLWHRGKCRACLTAISPIYPLVEFVTGCVFALSYWMLGFQVELLIALLFISLLMIVTVSDVSYMLIPNKILFVAGVLLLMLRVVYPLTTVFDSFIAALMGYSILLIIAILTRGGIGGGDLKLFLVIGIVLGTSLTFLTLFLSSVIGLVVSSLIIRKKALTRDTPIPFGPSISIAAIIAYFWGAEIVDQYMSLF